MKHIILNLSEQIAGCPALKKWERTVTGMFRLHQRRNHIFGREDGSVLPLPYRFPFITAHHYLLLMCNIDREHWHNGFNQDNTFFTCKGVQLGNNRYIFNGYWKNNLHNNIPILLYIKQNNKLIEASFWNVISVGSKNDPARITFQRNEKLNNLNIKNI